MKANLKKRHLSKQEKTEVIAQYYRLVKKIAYGYSQKCNDTLEDLMQVGFIALLEAAENFETLHNTLFKTYATHYISGHIRHYLRDKQHLMRGPRSLQELSFKVTQTTKVLTQKLGRDPNQEELSIELNIPKNRIDEVKDYEMKISIIWLDQLVNNDSEEERTKMDLVFDIKNSYTFGELIEDKILLKDAMTKLEPKLRELIELRYYKDLTQNELSTRLGISQMEVCRKLKKAEKELRALII